MHCSPVRDRTALEVSVVVAHFRVAHGPSLYSQLVEGGSAIDGAEGLPIAMCIGVCCTGSAYGTHHCVRPGAAFASRA